MNKPQINYPISRNPWQVIISGPVERNLTRQQRLGRLADVLGRAVQHLLGGEPREAAAALVRRARAAVPRRQPPVPPRAVVAALAVGEAALGVAEGAHAAVAVAVARGVLQVLRVKDMQGCVKGGAQVA